MGALEQLSNLFAKLIKFNTWGNYPAGYDPAKHGPYNPSRYYGKPDTPFGEVKLRELPKWFRRREIGFKPFTSLISRAHWRWQMKYVHPRKTTMAPVFQIAACGAIFGYVINYMRIRGHRHFEYH